jgi:hypothetical protein
MDQDSAGWTIEQQRRVWEFLTEVRGDPGRPTEDLQRNADTWANTGDLNEGWIGWVMADAAKLLDELPPPTGSSASS